MPSGALSLIINLLYVIILCQFIACTSCASVTQGGNLFGRIKPKLRSMFCFQDPVSLNRSWTGFL